MSLNNSRLPVQLSRQGGKVAMFCFDVCLKIQSILDKKIERDVYSSVREGTCT